MHSYISGMQEMKKLMKAGNEANENKIILYFVYNCVARK